MRPRESGKDTLGMFIILYEFIIPMRTVSCKIEYENKNPFIPTYKTKVVQCFFGNEIFGNSCFHALVHDKHGTRIPRDWYRKIGVKGGGQ